MILQLRKSKIKNQKTIKTGENTNHHIPKDSIYDNTGEYSLSKMGG
jgi:hypothetical protein